MPAIEDRAVHGRGGRDGGTAASIAEGYELIDHRDLEAALPLSSRRRTDVRGVDVDRAPGLKVGYVMGIGDQVPRGHRSSSARR